MKLNFDIIHSFIKKHAFTSGVFAIIFGFVFFSFSLVAANGQTLGPSDNHIVSLYADDSNSSVPTRAETVGEFLEKANIKLGEYD